MKHSNSQAGLIKLLILILIAVLILSYFQINIQEVAESPTGRNNFGYLWELTKTVGEWLKGMWDQYLAGTFNPILEKLSGN